MGNATNAGATLTVEGKDYEMSPLTVRDLEWIENDLKIQAIKNGRKAIDEELPQDQKDLMLRAVIAEANKLTITSAEGSAAMESFWGMSRMIWRMVLPKNPNVTLGFVQAWLEEPEVRTEAMLLVGVLNATIFGGAKKGAQKVTTPAPPAKKR